MQASARMAVALAAAALLALPCSAVTQAAEAHLRGQSSYRRVHLALLAMGTNTSSDEDADGAEAAVEEAERLAAKEEAMLSSSGNAASGANDRTSENTTAGAGVPATKERNDIPSLAAKWKETSMVSTGPRLQVTIVSAWGLKGSLAGGVTSMGMTDPYCICEVMGKPHLRFQTLALDGINGPRWNHVNALEGFGADDSLRFSVYDRDALRDQSLLGSVDLPVWRVGKDGFRGELPLAGAGRDGDSAYLKLAVERRGFGWDAAAWEHLAEEAKEKAQDAQEDEAATEDAADAEEDDQDDDDDDDDDDEADDAKKPPSKSGPRAST